MRRAKSLRLIRRRVSQACRRCLQTWIASPVPAPHRWRMERLESRVLLNGITLITHGWNGSADEPSDWVTTMAAAITREMGGADAVAEYVLRIDNGLGGGDPTVSSVDRISGTPTWSTASSGNAVIAVDWSDLDGGPSPSTGEVANVLAAYLRNNTLNGLSFFGSPIHLIGHSRGGSLMAALAHDLAVDGIWIDQLTTLDPHPVEWIGFNNDHPMVLYDNVIFADNYYRQDGLFEHGGLTFDFDGEAVTGALNRELVESILDPWPVDDPLDIIPDGAGYSLEHSDTHLYYYGTIDQSINASDGSHTVPSDWYYWPSLGMGPRDRTGYYYSRTIGGPRPSQGVASRFGGEGTRVETDPGGSYQWPNIDMITTIDGNYTYNAGDTVDVRYVYQDRDSTATINWYLDSDENPFNGFGQQLPASGGSLATSSQVRPGTYTFGTTGFDGTYYLLGKISDGLHDRFAYAPAPIQISAVQTGSYLSVSSGELVWDDSGPPHGDDDGIAEPGESNLRLRVRLHGNQKVTNPTGILSLADPSDPVQITDATAYWDDIAPGSSALSGDYFQIDLTNLPNQSAVPFVLHMSYRVGGVPYQQDLFFTPTTFVRVNPAFSLSTFTIDDSPLISSQNNGNWIAESGETVHVRPRLTNTGSGPASRIKVRLRDDGSGILNASDGIALQEYPDLLSGESGDPEGGDYFTLQIPPSFSGAVTFSAEVVLGESPEIETSLPNAFVVQVAAAAWLSATDQIVDLGVVVPSEPGMGQFTVRNSGTAALTITGFATSHGDTTVSGPGLPLTIQGGAIETFTVGFTPSAALNGQSIVRTITVQSDEDARVLRDRVTVSALVASEAAVSEVPTAINASNADVSGPWIVWDTALQSGLNSDIGAYNIATGSLVSITSDQGGHWNPHISGSLVVWEESDSSGVYGYDLDHPDLGTFLIYDGPYGDAIMGLGNGRILVRSQYSEYVLNSSADAWNLVVLSYDGAGSVAEIDNSEFAAPPGGGTYNSIERSHADVSESMATFRYAVINQSNQIIASERQYMDLTSGNPTRTGTSAVANSGYYVAAGRDGFVFTSSAGSDHPQLWRWTPTGGSVQLTSDTFGYGVVAYGGPTSDEYVVAQHADQSAGGLFVLKVSTGQQSPLETAADVFGTPRIDGSVVVWPDWTKNRVSYFVIEQADVGVSAGGIHLITSDPVEGQSVALDVDVQNLSSVDAAGPVTLSAYLGNPEAQGVLLGTVELPAGVAANSLETAHFDGLTFPSEGEAELWIVVSRAGIDPAANNAAAIQVDIGDSDLVGPVVSGVSISEYEGDGDGIIGSDERILVGFQAEDQSGIAEAEVMVDGTPVPVSLVGDQWQAVTGPLGPGEHTFEISVVDADVSSESTSVQGQVAVVEAEKVAVRFRGVRVTEGAINNVDLGAFEVGLVPDPLTFVIENVGGQDLRVSGIESSVSVQAMLSDSDPVGPGGVAYFTLTPDAAAVGPFAAEISLSNSATVAPWVFTVTGTVTPVVNDAPSFARGPDQYLLEDSGSQTVDGWAMMISPGAANEGSQQLQFVVNADNEELFATLPAVSANGVLTYTPAANANGSATVTVTLQDDGGTVNGGVDTSAEQTFTITVNPVNDAPIFMVGADQQVSEDDGAQSIVGFATSIVAGPVNEGEQVLSFNVTTDNDALFSVLPAISSDGVLTYTPAANANGSVTVTVTLQDDGGTVNGGVDTSAEQTFTITVNLVNDAPSFSVGSDQQVDEDAGAQSVSNWANNLSAGPANESSQNLSFLINTDNSALFSVQPAISASGTLTYTSATHANGSATITVRLHDDGGTANGGVDTSALQSFTITVNAVNDPPSFSVGPDQQVDEDTGAESVSAFATDILCGPVDESGQTLTFQISTDNDALFSNLPAISSSGVLTYAPAAHANGSATVTVSLYDDGGTTNGGVDRSTERTFTITVNPINDAPTLGGFGVLADGVEDQQQVIAYETVLSRSDAADIDGDAILFRLVSLNGGSLTKGGMDVVAGQTTLGAGEELLWTPAANVNGQVLAFSLEAVDGELASSSSADVQVDVAPVNDAPTFSSVETLTGCFEDTSFIIEYADLLLASDADDIDGDPLLLVIQTITSGSLTKDGVAVTPGTTTLAAGETLEWAGPADVNGIVEAFTVSVSDSELGSDVPVEVNISVASVNDAPSFSVGSNQQVDEDAGQQTVNNFAGNISAGPAGESGQVLTFQITTDNDALFAVLPAITSGGTLTYTPANDANGSATVRVTLRDDGGTANGGVDTSGDYTVTIAVTLVNDAPTISSETTLTGGIEDAQYHIAYADLLAASNADDVDGDTLTFTIQSVTNGTLTKGGIAVIPGSTNLAPGEELDWTGPADANSLIGAFTVNVTDGLVTSDDQAAVSIALASVNDVPNFSISPNQQVNEDVGAQTVSGFASAISSGSPHESSQSVSFLISADNEALFAVLPAITSGGTLSYTPATNANGSAQITIRLQDSGGTVNGGVDTSAPQLFTITVNSINDAPTISSVGTLPGGFEDTQYGITYADLLAASNANDIDGDTLTFTIQGVTSGMLTKGGVAVTPGSTTLVLGEELSWAGLADANGVIEAFTVNVTDGQLTSDNQAAVSVELALVNDAPSFSVGADQQVDEDAGAESISGFASNILVGPGGESGQILTFQISTDSDAQFSVLPAITSGGTLTYTPAANANGSAVITVRLHDSGGTANGGVDTSAEQSFTITVNPVNDAPTLTSVSTLSGGVEDVSYDIPFADLLFASDASDIDSVNLSFRIDAVLSGTLEVDGQAVSVGSTIVSAGQTLSWTPSANANGTLQAFRVSSYDEELFSTGNAIVSVDVVQVNNPPVIGSFLPSSVLIEKGQNFQLNTDSLTDIDSAISTVNFYVDADGDGELNANVDTLLGSVAPAAGSASVTVSSTTLATGDHVFFAQAVDSDGAESGILAIEVAVLRVLHFAGASGNAVYTDADGDIVTVSLSGPGAGKVQLANDGGSDALLIELMHTTTASSLTISSRGAGTVNVGSIQADGDLKSISGLTTNLLDGLVLPGLISTISLRDVGPTPGVGGQAIFDIGVNADLEANPRASLSVNLNRVNDLTFQSALPVSSFNVLDWQDLDADQADSLTAPSVGSLSAKGDSRNGIAGDLQTDITISNAAASQALGKTSIKGTYSGTIMSAAGVGAFSAGAIDGLTLQIDAGNFDGLNAGEVTDANLNVAGAIKAIKATQWNSGNITAGSIGGLTVSGDSRNGIAGDFTGEINVTGEAAQQSLGKTSVKGTFSGSVNSAGAVGAIAAGATDELTIELLAGNFDGLSAGQVTATTLTVPGAIKSIKATQWNSGDITAGSIGSLTVSGDTRNDIAGDFTGNIVANDDTARSALGKTSIKGTLSGSITSATPVAALSATAMNELTFEQASGDLGGITAGLVTESSFTVPGVIKSVKASNWSNSTINAASVGSLTINGDTRNNIAGDFTGGMNLTDAAARQSLGKTSVKGTFSANLELPSGLGAFTAGAITDAVIHVLAGNFDGLTAGQVDNLDLEVADSIKSIKAVQWNSGNIDAASLGGLTVSGNARNGIAGDFTGNLTLTDETARQGLGRSSIKGTMAGSIIQVAAAMGALTAGSIEQSEIHVLVGNFDGLTAGQVTDLILEVDASVKNIKVVAWDGGSITAGDIASLAAGGDSRNGIAGDFSGGVTLTNEAARQGLGKLTIAGTLRDSAISTPASVGSVSLGAMENSSLFAGINDGVNGLIDNAADFANQAVSIGSVSIKGITANVASLVNSMIAAWSIGKTTLAEVEVGNGATPYGLSADRISSLSYLLEGTKVTEKSNLSSNADLKADVARGNFTISLVDL